ncbi:MAG: hypothetical protein HUJ26_02730 [Planctomycetaceae bacterium]|nr:hypothetical protein [Planctomycetaceae bacterium]
MQALTRLNFSIALFLSGILAFSTSLTFADLQEDLKILTDVDHRAAGNIEAQAAYASLVKNDRDALPQILKAMNGANPLAENYLRSAFEVIVADGEGDLPMGQLAAYLQDQENNQKARSMVFELLKHKTPAKADKMLDGMLKDSSAEIRYQAVQKVIDRAKKLDAGEQKKEAYLTALSGASEEGQVKAISDALKEMDVEVDLQKHFGLLTDWKIIGPFDNKEMKAFDIAYPPEEELDFGASYEGMEGPVQWQTITTDDPMGAVDIAKSIGPYKGAVMYMYSEYDSPSEQDVYFRMATANAWKLWVNGELVFAREEYHRGMRWDQYRVPVSLKEGKNEILFKILQNEQTQPWAQDYKIQMRVCDQSGQGLLPRTSYDPNK